MSIPPHPEIPGEGLGRENEYELERRAERHSKLHGEDGDTSPRVSLIRRILNILRRYRR